MVPDDLHDAAVARVAAIATLMNAEVPTLARTLHKVLAESIEELQGDQLILELLEASIESNLETVAHILRYDIDVDEVSTPSAAEEYARRLAQRGIAPIALVRAYRLGQQQVVDWAFDELARTTPTLASTCSPVGSSWTRRSATSTGSPNRSSPRTSPNACAGWPTATRSARR